MPMISIKNLQKRFGRKVILNDLDLEVDKGDFLVLFGPNGAGKTTLIKILIVVAIISIALIIVCLNVSHFSHCIQYLKS